MVENSWIPLPFPFWELATPKPGARRELPGLLERLLEDAAGQAGVLAAATLHPETDEADVRFALRVLSENLHAAVVLWRQWLNPQEGGEAVAED